MAKRPYSVRLLVSDLALGTSGSDGYQLPAGSSFVAESATREVFGPALTGLAESARVLPLVTVNLKDNISGQGIFSEPVPITTVTGDAKNPYFFQQPLRFESKPYLEASNFSTDTAYKRVYVVLHGYLDDRS